MSDLFVPGKPRILSTEEARQLEQEQDASVPELDRPNAFVTRAWALEVFAKIGVNMTEQLYEQFGQETAANLATMEKIVTERVAARVFLDLDRFLRERVWYRRWYRFAKALVGYSIARARLRGWLPTPRRPLEEAPTSAEASRPT